MWTHRNGYCECWSSVVPWESSIGFSSRLESFNWTVSSGKWSGRGWRIRDSALELKRYLAKDDGSETWSRTSWSLRRCILETPSVWKGFVRSTKSNQGLQRFKLMQRWWIPCLNWSFYHWGIPINITRITRMTVPCDGSWRTEFLWVLCVRHNLEDVFVNCRSASRRIVTAFGATSLLRVAEKEAVDAKQVRVWSRCSLTAWAWVVHWISENWNDAT